MNSVEPKLPTMRPSWLWAACAGLALALVALCLWTTAGHGGLIWIGWLIASAVFGIGLWLERGTEHRRPFAELLIAGGIAAFIGVVCAGQRQEPPGFLHTKFVACIFIAIGAIGLAWTAEARRSLWLGTTGLALAWLVITLQQFTVLMLAADALLLAVALRFFFRQGWIACVWLMLVALHLGFLLGWPFSGGRLDPDRYLYLREYWWTLIVYTAFWALFTWVALFSPAAAFTPSRRLQFATLNNALFFTIGALIVPPSQPRWFWKFSFAAGVLILIAWVLNDRSPRLRFAYAAHGGLLITLGIFASVIGREPAALLSVATVFFVLSVDRREQWFLRYCAIATALLTFGFAWEPAYWNDEPSLWLGVFTGAPLVFASIWISRHRESWWRWTVLFYGALGLGMWLLTTLAQVPAQYHPPLLAVYAVIVTASILVLGIPEWPFLAASVLLLAHFLWFRQTGSFNSRPWWNPCVVVLCTLGLSQWWQSRGHVLLSARVLKWLQGVFALVAVAILILSAESGFGMSSTGLLVISLLAVGVTFYASAARDWLLFGLAQLIVATTVGEFIGQLSHPPLPFWIAALIPIAALLLVAPALTSPFTRTEWEEPARRVALLYRAVAAAMFVVWTLHYFNAANRFIGLALAAVAMLLVHLARRPREPLIASVVCAAGALLAFWLAWTGANGFRLRDFLAFVLLLCFGQIIRIKKLLPDELQSVGIILGLTAVTQWVENWIGFYHPGVPASVVWAIVAAIIVCVGWLLNERLYRVFGWVLLLAALGRVVWLDLIESNLPPGTDPAFRLGLLAVGLAALIATLGYARRSAQATK